MEMENIKVAIMVVVMDVVGDVVEDVLVIVIMVFIVVVFLTTRKKNSNKGQERGGQNNPSKVIENVCYQCASIKGKKNNIETNFISQNDEMEAKEGGDF
ncbi:hypothetical protein J1N35_014431 [Gossypium stocksii]|uniref:Uncharacterized protein n=1 Tax=Gossypium stocksii TaxID=47602 RepID=A0A9D3VU31_9ROSI|nr:hypothetical protein J1N35_014431 [Gossypium stocksii]